VYNLVFSSSSVRIKLYARVTETLQLFASLLPIKMSLPKLIGFDLDGTIWSPDMYMLWGGGSPFKVVGDGTSQLKDSAGCTVSLLGVSGYILHDLKHDPKWNGTICALVSCTDEPTWAQECLQKFKTTPGNETLLSCVDSSQIYKGNKQNHYKKLKKEYPHIEYSEMMFFDNEMGNIRSVSALGVHSVYCPDGITEQIWDEGLREFASRS
jgi:magnesium-dependent phosphatase 1